MTKKSPKILALDFDGVICDGLVEYFQVAWRTYSQIWLFTEDKPAEDLALRFYRLRPVIETGWEMPILIKALVSGFSDQEILQGWTHISAQILSVDNLNAKEVATKLDTLRDEWIALDLDGWLELHKFYPGIVEKIRLILASEIQLYIVTTKEGRFVEQLLQKAGLNFPSTSIFGKEVKRPKSETLRKLIFSADIQPRSLWFVEDRLKTLQLVRQEPDLQDVQLFLADWGYNTQIERETAAKEPDMQLISLEDFAQDFSAWY
jgi:phosphoglycolate phosphatase-like HAD superfamily hydrolase